MFCSKITPLFPVMGLIFPTQMYFSHSSIKPCTRSDTDLLQHQSWCLEPSQQQDFSYWSSHRRTNSQDRSRISCPTSCIQYLNSSLQSVKTSGLIHLNHSWYLFSVGIDEILGTVAAMGWDPKGCLMAPVPAWSLDRVRLEPVEMFPAIFPASLPKVQVS